MDIEGKIREFPLFNGQSVKVLKRNPGHISLVEIEMILQPETIKTISKHCGERIIFKLKDEKEAKREAYFKWEKEQLKRIRRRLKRKAKRKRKMILKTIYYKSGKALE
ncbi:MAG: hypothetical protein M0Z72_07475 [Deltaproteobacteria bacterium]|nr:hypothetical protein [Deltaproteobacteria bacterium]